jgi:hypothetical protein
MIGKILSALFLAVTCSVVAIAQPTAALKLLAPNDAVTYRSGTSQDLRWDTTDVQGNRTYNQRFTFQWGTSPTGPWTNLTGATNRRDSAGPDRASGVYAGGLRVPFVAQNNQQIWIRIVLVNQDNSLNESVFDVSDNPITVERPEAIVADEYLEGSITGVVTLDATKIYGLKGYVFVEDGATLVIPPGTIIIGDQVGTNSALCVNRGGKIYAKGTPTKPIIMTSSAPPGQRRSGDWGGLLICGKASTNHPGGESALEGGIADDATIRSRGWFGGKTTPDDNDSSGHLEYVRIEFAGIAAAPNQELNSLTMGGVGRRTVLKHIQCSYGNDDAFEWFGGTVNAKYLIATQTLDDDLDCDNGFSGKVQFALVQRNPQRADVSTSQAFEIDNDASASFNTPLTRPVFSNVTAIGPVQDMSWTTGPGANQYSTRFGAGAQIRRNARASIFNSVFTGWPRGIEILSNQGQGAASRDSIQIKNNSWYGVKAEALRRDGTMTLPENWLESAGFNNVIDASSPANAMLTNQHELDRDINPVPTMTSPLNSGASFVATNADVIAINDPFFTQVNYRGAFSSTIAERWDLPWAEYEPITAIYERQVNVPDVPTAALKLTAPNAQGLTFRAGTSQDLRWDTTDVLGSRTYNQRFTFQWSTSPDGPWTNLTGATNRKDSAGPDRASGVFAGGFRVPNVPQNNQQIWVRIVMLNPDLTLNETVSDVCDFPITVERPDAIVVDEFLEGNITGVKNLDFRKVYGLKGYVFVEDGATLVIPPGTIIVGDQVGTNSAICVNRGGKIYAKGTKERPIIMTSSAPPGQRRSGDWGGLLICGKAATNHPGGESALEGGIADDATIRLRGWFGGKTTPDDNDSSGHLEYVRIEFAGIAAAPNQELNSLTMGGVGRRTVLKYIQCSYGNDDAFEWFGGSVNAKYLVATGTLDDDLDCDNGYSGKVQFALVQRFPQRADVSTSQAFEIDNDASASFNTPLTSPVFSNVTAIGPVQDMSWTTGPGANQYSTRFGAGAQIRRNARASIFNSVFTGWPRGIEILSNQGQGAASRDSLQIKNNSWYGVKGEALRRDGTMTLPENWLQSAGFNNVIDASSPSAAQLVNPNPQDNDFDPRPSVSSPFLTNASFTATNSDAVAINDPFFTQVAFRGAFAATGITERWDYEWTEYEPITSVYTPFSDEVSVNEPRTTPTVSVSVTPNPANNVAKFLYNLKNEDVVTIKIINAFGVEVATIAENVQQNNSYYEFSLNTSILPTGVYFVQISTRANGFISEKFTVVR